MIEMKTYCVTVKHDNGKCRISLMAQNEDAAKRMIMKAENCPECAIQKIEVSNKKLRM